MHSTLQTLNTSIYALKANSYGGAHLHPPHVAGWTTDPDRLSRTMLRRKALFSDRTSVLFLCRSTWTSANVFELIFPEYILINIRLSNFKSNPIPSIGAPIDYASYPYPEQSKANAGERSRLNDSNVPC